MRSSHESMPGHLWKWHDELREFTYRELMRLPVCRALDMPHETDLSELIVVDSAILVERGGHLFRVSVLIAIWPGPFGWYRITGLPLGHARSDWPVYE